MSLFARAAQATRPCTLVSNLPRIVTTRPPIVLRLPSRCASSARKAPKTSSARGGQKMPPWASPVPPAQQESFVLSEVPRILRLQHGVLETPAASEELHAFAEGLVQCSVLVSSPGYALPAKAFAALRAKHSWLQPDHLWVVSNALSIRTEGQAVSSKIMHSLADEGHIHALLVVLNNYHRYHEYGYNTLDNSEFQRMFAKLHSVLRAEDDAASIWHDSAFMKSDALTIESRILRTKKDYDGAIASMEEAWNHMVSANVHLDFPHRRSPSRAKDPSRRSDKSNKTVFAQNPWNYLFGLYHDAYQQGVQGQGKPAKDERVLESLVQRMESMLQVGLGIDDPVTHYHAATFTKLSRPATFNLSPAGVDERWVYLMTRAAMSGVSEAAYELGLHYEARGDAPAHVDLAAHGSTGQVEHTVANSRSDAGKDRKTRIFEALGIAGIDVKQEHSNFKHEPVARTAQANHELALQWFGMAATNYFAPAFMKVANLRLTLAGLLPGQKSVTTVPENKESPAVRDHIKAAQAALLECFNAGAFQVRSQARGKHEEKPLSMAHPDLRWTLNNTALRSWNRKNSRYYVNMEVATASLCDHYKVDVYDRNGAMIYKHN